MSLIWLVIFFVVGVGASMAGLYLADRYAGIWPRVTRLDARLDEMEQTLAQHKTTLLWLLDAEETEPEGDGPAPSWAEFPAELVNGAGWVQPRGE